MKSYSNKRPSTLEGVGNGSYLYHYDIEETKQVMGDEEIVMFEYEEVTVWGPLTSNKITEAVITEQWDANYEQKLVNEYNSAQIGMYEQEEAEMKIKAYKDYLNERARLKKIVDDDCLILGII